MDQDKIDRLKTISEHEELIKQRYGYDDCPSNLRWALVAVREAIWAMKRDIRREC